MAKSFDELVQRTTTKKRQAIAHRAQELLIACVIAGAGCQPAGLHQNADGTFSGTGDKLYDYDSGEKLRVDSYVNGVLKRSEWFEPNGTRAFATDWTGRGDGFEYYLYPNGKLRKKYTMRNGFAHGAAWEYDEDGMVVRTFTFVEGQEKQE